ncbi:MAG TPA: response regulator, partial [Polyangiaceae bacterium]|nr:response regulator [Polyangiaceae bacterium]
MPEHRILVVGRPSALTRDLVSFGNVVHHTASHRALWAGLPSGTWDACVLDTSQVKAEGPSLIRHARESQPQLAILLAGEDEEATRRLGLVTGADDVLVYSHSRLTVRRVSHAIAFRRAKARGRVGPTHANLLVLDWDPVEAPAVRNALAKHDFRVSRAEDPWSALSMLRASDFEILLTPPLMTVEGTGIVEAALRYDPRLRVIVTSDVPDLADAAAAMGHGAFDYLLRPVGTEQALGAVHSAWAAFTNTSPSGEPTARHLHVLIIENHALGPRVIEQLLAQDNR